MSVKALLAAAVAAVAVADDKVMKASVGSLGAVEQLAALRQAIDAEPKNVAEFLKANVGPNLLTVQYAVSEHILPRIATEFDHYIRRAMCHQLADEVSKKLPVEFVRSESAFPGSPMGYSGNAVYRALLYVLTRDELENLVREAFQAGRYQS